MEIKGYRIHHKVGRGGMGKVYKATHIASGKLVAIKVLERTENKRRFENEARLQANISHPNICRIYAYGEESGQPYIVMEYIEGRSLEEFLGGRPSMGLQNSLQVFRDICSAVAHLHSYRIIHRDIKPENIKVSSQGVVKLIDFGIARGISTPRLTATGQIIGTLQYIAPERFKNKCTAASDVWSLGVILYRICTGDYPFSGEDSRKLQLAISKVRYPEISGLDPNLSKGLKLIVDRCLQQKVSKRYEDANALLDDLDDYLSGKPPKGLNFENTREYLTGKPRKTVAVTGILVLVIAVISIVLAGGNSGSSTKMTGVVCVTVQNAQKYQVFVNGERCGTDCDCTVPLNTNAVVRVRARGYKTFEDEINIYKKRSYVTALMERK